MVSTVEYVRAAAEHVLRETGLLPHINAGVLSQEELSMLRPVSASQGLMLESTSSRLLVRHCSLLGAYCLQTGWKENTHVTFS